MSPDIESLLGDEGWVRALARRLVREKSEADDLVQEAWLAARREPPGERTEEGLRRWFGAVLRNRARQDSRTAARREGRERNCARPEAQPGPEELLQRLELRERVVDAVRALEEPYQSAILLRWFEGLSPREIARRRGVPRRTVHSWLARGLERLRERLRRDLGPERDAWLLALMPLCKMPPAPAGATPGGLSLAAGIGAIAVTAQAKLIVFVAVALLAVYLALPERPEGLPAEPLRSVAAAGPEPSRAASPEAPAALGDLGATREALPAPVEAAPPAPFAPAQAPFLLRGRVIDVEDRPLGSFALVLIDPGGERLAAFESASDGSFEVEVEQLQGELTVADPGWTEVLQPMLSRHDWPGGLVLVAAPRIALGGWVRSAQGQPLAGARVAVKYSADVRARLTHMLDNSVLVHHECLADIHGHFELPAVPSMRLAALRVDHQGYQPRELPLPELSSLDLEVVLAPLGPELRMLVGRVVDERGAPLAGAWVALDGETTRSGEDGGFVLEVGEPGATGVLWAAAAGRTPARLERSAPSNLDAHAWPQPLELVVAGESGSIRGRVLDAEGAAVAGARLRLVDPTPFGSVPLQGHPDLKVGCDLESLLAGRLYSYGGVESGQDGRFEIPGLLARSYVVEVSDVRTLAHEQVQLVPGPQEVVIRLSPGASPRRVAGRVIHPDGTPAAGVEVVLGVEHTQLEAEPVRAGEDGRFEIPRASGLATRVTVRGSGPGGGGGMPLPPGDVDDLVIVFARRCHVQVVLADPAEATAYELLDASGRGVHVLHFQGNLVWAATRGPLAEGRSQAVLVDELTRTLVLYRGEEEVRRVGLKLVPGELTIVGL